MQSRRDLMIREFVGQRLVRAHGEHTRHPALLLLGPRGSGKTTLAGRLETWGRRAPMAALDLSALDDGVHHPVDVLARIAFQLNARRADFPPLALPSFAVLLMALSAEADPESRDAALGQMREALRTGRAEDHSLAVLRDLVTSVGVPMGLPGWSAAVVPLIQGWQRARVWWGVHRRFGRVPRGGSRPQVPADALVELNQHFRHGTAAQRERAESVLLQAFLADLQGAYTRHGGDRARTLRCLVLLDNADSELGDAFLQALVEARAAAGPEHCDPLVVVASARRAPEVLRQLEQGPRPLGSYLSCWQPPEQEDGSESFVPRTVARPGGGARLEVAQLRPLDRAEVQEQAGPYVKRMPQAALAGITHPVAWLGRTVHELTRGHPAATGAVLAALEDFAPDVPCGQRLRRVLAPEGPHSVADELLELLLQDLPRELADGALPRAAAAVTLGQAASAAELWRQADAPPRLLRGLAHDDRHAERITFDGQPHSALPAMVRTLLLGRLSLATAPADAGVPWVRTHEILRDAAESGRAGAYHRLAAGDVQGAAAYLHERFLDVCGGGGSAQAWCAELSFIQRAPRRWEADTLERTPGAEFQHRLARAQSPPDQLMVTRLLVAGWITTHPASDPCASLWSDPLGDPVAELYPKIVDALQTLSGRLGDETDHDVLWQRAAAYERKPW
ncbi:ATP-binding protein [Streptomyces chrestomyceticus]|uniref:ATP-binding protein n=1 Tax=Streptomyces chrestomyceticus TaxID=68185 RepID=UPI0033E7218D